MPTQTRPFFDSLAIYRRDAFAHREDVRDDGDVVTTQLWAGELGNILDIDWIRATRKVVVRGAPNGRIEREVPEGVFVYEAGDFFALVRAADGIPPSTSGTMVGLLSPTTGRVVPGLVSVEWAPNGSHRTVTVRIGAQTIVIEVGDEGRVETVRSDPGDLVAINEQGGPYRWMTESPTPDGRPAKLVLLSHDDARLYGTIFEPQVSGEKPPAVVFVSSPPDHEGTMDEVHVDAMQSIAQALMQQGVATLLYERYGLPSAENVSLAGYAADAATCVDALRASGRYASVSVIGHGQGGLVALSIPAASRPDALVLVAAGGRPNARRLCEHWKRNLPSISEDVLESLLARVRCGERLTDLPADESRLLGDTGPWFQTSLDVDPAVLLARTPTPTTVIYADADDSVSVEDVKRLVGSRPGITRITIHGAEHYLLNDTILREHVGTFVKGEAPLAGGVVEAIVSALRGS